MGKARAGSEGRSGRDLLGGTPSPAPAGAPRPAKPQSEAEADGDDVADREAGSRAKEATERKDSGDREAAKKSAKKLSVDLTLTPVQVKALLAHLDRERLLRVSAKPGTPAPVADPVTGDAGVEKVAGGAGSAPADSGAGRAVAEAPSGATVNRLRIALRDDQALLEALRRASKKTGNTVLRLVGPASARVDRAATGR